MDQLFLHEGSVGYQCLRELLLSTSERQCKVARELWHGPHGTYQAYRQYLRKSVRPYGFPSQRQNGLFLPPKRSHSSDITARKKPYVFSGIKHLFDVTQLGITALAFGSLSSEILAFANVSGDVWVVSLPPDDEPSVSQMQHVHKRAVSALDWSFDNTLLLTTSQEGAACLWAPPATDPIRTLTVRGAATSCKFHPTNPNLLLIGTSKGIIEIFNASTGGRVQKQSIPGGAEVTALLVTNTHVFAADSCGSVFMFGSPLRGGLLQRLVMQHRLHVSLSPQSPVISLGLQRFCQSADNCPVLLAACLDSTMVVIKIIDMPATNRLEVHSRHTAPRMARRIVPQWCPVVALQDSDFIAMGAEDTRVYIYDLARHLQHPLAVTELQGHCAPTTLVSWSYDERLLASADCNGTVIVWNREEPGSSVTSTPLGTPRSSISQQLGGRPGSLSAAHSRQSSISGAL